MQSYSNLRVLKTCTDKIKTVYPFFIQKYTYVSILLTFKIFQVFYELTFDQSECKTFRDPREAWRTINNSDRDSLHADTQKNRSDTVQSTVSERGRERRALQENRK